MNEYLYLFILSLIQGLAEVLPISSSGHLVLINEIFSLGEMNLTFAIALHVGSFIAILLWFRRDIIWLWHSLLAPLNKAVPRLEQLLSLQKTRQFIAYYFVLSLLPVALVGAALKPIVENVFANPVWVAIFLIVNGIIILATAHWSHGERILQELTWKEFLLVGLVQSLAVLPGISRLGITLCIGLFLRLSWYEALRLSFILAIPVIASSATLEFTTGIGGTAANLPGGLLYLVLSVFTVVIISWLALKMLMRSWLERRTLVFFGHYCWMWGCFSLIYMLPTIIEVTS